MTACYSFTKRQAPIDTAIRRATRQLSGQAEVQGLHAVCEPNVSRLCTCSWTRRKIKSGCYCARLGCLANVPRTSQGQPDSSVKIQSRSEHHSLTATSVAFESTMLSLRHVQHRARSTIAVVARCFSLNTDLHPTTSLTPTATSFAVTNPATAQTITHLETIPIAALDEVDPFVASRVE